MRDLVMLLRANGKSGLVAILFAAAVLLSLLLPVYYLLKDQVTTSIVHRLLLGRSPQEVDATATCADYISARVPLSRGETSGAASASAELRLTLARAAANVSHGASLPRVAYEAIEALRSFAIGSADGGAPLRAVSACLGVPFEDAWRMHAALSSVASNSHRRSYVRVLSPPDCAPGTRAVIVIHSPPVAAERRQLIRDAWSGGRLVDRRFRLVFAVGRAATAAASERDLAAEYAAHDDILAHDFVDDYYHMPLKTLLAMQWVSERCSLAAYMVKADEDVYINPQNLHVLLLARPPSERKIIGNIGRGMQPHRSLESKWYVPGDAFSGAEYPAFAFSPCYVVSVAVLADLIASCKRLSYLYLEDVFVTGLCAAGDMASSVEHESAPSFLASSCEEFPDPVAVQLIDRPYARCGA